mmetsp:Transcript_12902/g.36753  ORF Transcript_12902/g.36753 Transcript_12902/m.36753 type:complete len:229 (+) Transcript_12902:621-1307(+)
MRAATWSQILASEGLSFISSARRHRAALNSPSRAPSSSNQDTATAQNQTSNSRGTSRAACWASKRCTHEWTSARAASSTKLPLRYSKRRWAAVRYNAGNASSGKARRKTSADSRASPNMSAMSRAWHLRCKRLARTSPLTESVRAFGSTKSEVASTTCAQAATWVLCRQRSSSALAPPARSGASAKARTSAHARSMLRCTCSKSGKSGKRFSKTERGVPRCKSTTLKL